MMLCLGQRLNDIVDDRQIIGPSSLYHVYRGDCAMYGGSGLVTTITNSFTLSSTGTQLLNLSRLIGSRFTKPILNAAFIHQVFFTSGSIAGTNMIR